GAVAPRHGARVVERFTGNRPLDRFRERHQVQLWTAAARYAEAGQRDRCTHQLQKSTPRPFVAVELRCAGRKFALEPFPELGRVAQLIGAAPVTAARGWSWWMVEDPLHGSIAVPAARPPGVSPGETKSDNAAGE